jgi:hypothetical protein
MATARFRSTPALVALAFLVVMTKKAAFFDAESIVVLCSTCFMFIVMPEIRNTVNQMSLDYIETTQLNTSETMIDIRKYPAGQISEQLEGVTYEAASMQANCTRFLSVFSFPTTKFSQSKDHSEARQLFFNTNNQEAALLTESQDLNLAHLSRVNLA